MSDANNNGSVTIASFAVIKNIRPATGQKDNSRSMALDAYLYMGDGADDLLASLRFWNADGIALQNDTLYFVHANVVPFPQQPLYDVMSPSLGNDDFDLLGDTNFLTVMPCKKVPCVPFLYASGLVRENDRQAATFVIEPHVYTFAAGKATPFHLSTAIPDAPKFKSGRKPVPMIGSFTSFHGVLASVDIDPVTNVRSFTAESQDINFLGRPTLPSSSPSMWRTRVTASPGKLMVSFKGDFRAVPLL